MKPHRVPGPLGQIMRKLNRDTYGGAWRRRIGNPTPPGVPLTAERRALISLGTKRALARRAVKRDFAAWRAWLMEGALAPQLDAAGIVDPEARLRLARRCAADELGDVAPLDRELVEKVRDLIPAYPKSNHDVGLMEIWPSHANPEAYAQVIVLAMLQGLLAVRQLRARAKRP